MGLDYQNKAQIELINYFLTGKLPKNQSFFNQLYVIRPTELCYKFVNMIFV